jgi:hypothetical protein
MGGVPGTVSVSRAQFGQSYIINTLVGGADGMLNDCGFSGDTGPVGNEAGWSSPSIGPPPRLRISEAGVWLRVFSAYLDTSAV